MPVNATSLKSSRAQTRQQRRIIVRITVCGRGAVKACASWGPSQTTGWAQWAPDLELGAECRLGKVALTRRLFRFAAPLLFAILPRRAFGVAPDVKSWASSPRCEPGLARSGGGLRVASGEHQSVRARALPSARPRRESSALEEAGSEASVWDVVASKGPEGRRSGLANDRAADPTRAADRPPLSVDGTLAAD